MTASIHDIAAQWQVRIAAGPLPTDAEIALDLWLGADPSHAIALAEAGIAWYGSTNAAAGLKTARTRVHQRSAWRPWLAGAVAAPLMLMVLAMAPAWWAALRADAHTGVGETRNLTLEDGSTVTLDTDSAVAVAFTANERRVRVLRGAAFFEVQPNPTRPFVVDTDGVTARALGTAYSVDSAGRELLVAVEHGVVAVGHDGDASLATLSAGEGVRIDATSGKGITLGDGASAALAWHRGVLSFRGTRLRDALARLDRYVPGRVLLLDDAVAEAPVTAVFPVGDAAMAIDALARSHGLSVQHWPGLIVLRRQ